MKQNPYNIVQMFEDEVSTYTSAPFAVAVDSCTNALFLCLKYLKARGMEIEIPKKTYLSVPMSIIHAGAKPIFKDIEWSGIYQLKPLPVYDAAKRFTSGMYIPGSFMCLSFHIQKFLSIGKGGMILTPDINAVRWFMRARYSGRSQINYKDDDIKMPGWNMYMTPQQAAHGLCLLQNYPQHMADLEEEGGYKDLTLNTLFRGPE